MKKKIIESIKIVVGTILGTGTVMYSMWYMLDVVLHPFAIILVLIVLFVVGIIISGVTMGYKGIIVVLGSFIFGLWGFSRYYNYTCNPNQADVELMRPMTQKISDYIVKNGIPESLRDIPDLPYGLEGCEKHQKNLEKCIFYKNNKEYESEIYILGDIYIEIYSKQTKTGLRYELTKNSSIKNWLISKSNIAFSSKNSGICKPWRQ